jgi:hypothetical protein
MADTHSHDAQVHRHEHTHITQNLRHGQQGEHMDTSHDTSTTTTTTTTTTPPSAMPPSRRSAAGCCASARHRPVRGRRAVAQASPCSGGAGRLAAAPRGLGSRHAETTQSDYGRHLESVPMIVLFVPHAAG